MSSLKLVEFVATENHVKFRSLLGEMLYARLSEEIKEKTKDMVAEIFNTERVDDMTPLVEYVGEVILAAENALETELTEEEINETTSYILSLLEEKDEEEDDDDKKKKMKKKDDEDEEEDEEEEDEEEEDEEDEEEEDEDEEEVEDKQEKEEDKDEKKAGKKAKQVFHFDINSHKKG